MTERHEHPQDEPPQDEPPTRPEPEPAFAAFLAIDWANQKHYWSLQEQGSSQIERGTLDNTPEAIEVWVTELQRRWEGRPLAVALEQRRGALVAMLSKYAQLYLYPVHPLSLARYRQVFFPSGSKDDVKDADLLREMLCKHRESLRRLGPDSDDMRLLQLQVENRRKLIDERTALTNRLTDLLKLYYPQILVWFDDLTSPLVAALLECWPTLPELQKARAATLQKFFRKHHCRDQALIQQRIDAIGHAMVATHDVALIQAARDMVGVCLRQIAVLREAIAKLEGAIRELARRQPDWDIFESLPGAGDALAPRLMAAMGSRRERFASAAELQCYAGIAPVKEASGNTGRVHIRYACSKFLRQSFHEWAACSLPYCDWAKAYYQQQRSRNKSHHTAVRALAFKWMRILYRCWTTRQPYDEQRYLQRLKERGVPIARCAKAVQMS